MHDPLDRQRAVTNKLCGKRGGYIANEHFSSETLQSEPVFEIGALIASFARRATSKPPMVNSPGELNRASKLLHPRRCQIQARGHIDMSAYKSDFLQVL